MSAPIPATTNLNQPIAATNSTRGRWKIGAGVLALAIVAQSILWSKWWDDPTHFKMSILFVWPATFFLLLIWWTFLSGWSARVRLRVLAIGVALVVAFFSIFRLERFDGDMTPTRLSLRWSPDPDQKARQYLEQMKLIPVAPPDAVETVGPLVAEEGDWPGFRGPRRDGIVPAVTLRTDWATRPPKEVWRHPVGKAWSSFAVVGEFAFTQEQRDDHEAVVAYRLSDGQQVWAHLDKSKFNAAEPQGGPGPRATPQFDEGKLYTLGATGILNCLDARTGTLNWSTNILKDAGTDGALAANLEWGLAGSPLIAGDLVIVIPGGPNGKSVVAYNKVSGSKVWSAGGHPATYASPSIATLNGQSIVLAPLGDGLSGHSLKDGRQLWFFEWTNGPKVCGATPVACTDKSVLYGIGYGVGTVRMDVGLDGDNWSLSEKWRSNRLRPKFNDFILFEGNIYGLDDGTLTCLDVESGKIKWKSGRYGYGQILLVDNLLLIVGESGTVTLVPATPSKPEVLASFPALDELEITWNQPVLVRGKLLVRNAREAACFDLE